MNLIYIAHTKERIWRDTYFSILTYLHYEISSTIWLFTDNPSYFDIPNLNIIPLNDAILQDWYGDINFIHRQKLMAIEYVTERSKGNILMLDGDISFTKNPLSLFKQISKTTSLMHASEGQLKTLTSKSGKALHRLIAAGDFPPITSNSIMFNAGVIGIAEENIPLEKEVLQLTEQLYKAQPAHVMEQLAHSVVLAKNTTIIEAKDHIFHWWGRGLNVEALLIPFFEKIKEKSLQERIEAATVLKKEVEQVPFNRKLSFLEKIRKKLKAF